MNKHQNLRQEKRKTNFKFLFLAIFCMLIFFVILTSSIANAQNKEDAIIDEISSSDLTDSSYDKTQKLSLEQATTINESLEGRTSVDTLDKLNKAINNDNIDTIIVTKQINLSGTQTIGHSSKIKTVRVERTGLNEATAIDSKGTKLNIFNIKAGANVTFQNLIIQGGRLPAIISIQAKLTLKNTAISLCAFGDGGKFDEHGNEHGGGIEAFASDIYMEDSIVARNAAYCGGGVWITSKKSIDDPQTYDQTSHLIADRCSFSENRSLGESGGGGAMEVQFRSFAYLNNCSFDNNTSTELGGAINLAGSTKGGICYALNTTFSGNGTREPGKFGGAIAGNSTGASDGYGKFVAANCLFAYNYYRIGNEDIAPCDVGNYTGNHDMQLYNCSYMALKCKDDMKFEDCKTKTYNSKQIKVSDNVFYKTVNTYLLYNPTSIPTQDFKRAMQARTLDGTYDLYPPIMKDSAIVDKEATDGCAYATYFKADKNAPEDTLVAIKSKSSDTKINVLNGTNPTDANLVTRTFEAKDNRKPSKGEFYFPGCSGVVTQDMYIMRLYQNIGGSATGASQSGDLVPSGGLITLKAYPNENQKFVHWIDNQTNEILSTNSTYSFNIQKDTEIRPVFEGSETASKASVYLNLDGNSERNKTVTLESDSKTINATYNTMSGAYVASGLEESTTYSIIVGSSKTGKTVTTNNSTTLNRYTITFDAGTNNMKIGTLISQDFVTDYDGLLNGQKPIDPTGDNLVFYRWATSAKGGEEANLSQQFKMPTTFYAQAYKNATEPHVTDLVYNREEQSGVVEGEGFHWEGQTSGTDAGTYTVKAVLEKGYLWPNGQEGDITKHFTIKIADIEVKIAGKKELTEYDGRSHEVDGCVITCTDKIFKADEISTSQDLHASGVDVGEYSPSSSIDLSKFTCSNSKNINANFSFAEGQPQNNKVTINPRNLNHATITILNPESYVYNGEDIKVKFAITDIVGNVNIIKDSDYEVAENSNIGHNAGKYTLKIKTKDTGSNYYDDGEYSTIEWIIKNGKINILISGFDASYDYDGREYLVDGYDASATGGDSVKLFDQAKVKLKEEAPDLSISGKDASSYNGTAFDEAFFYYDDANIDASFSINSTKPNNKLLINKRDLSLATIDWDQSSFQYSSKTINVDDYFTVNDNPYGSSIIENKDWEVVGKTDEGVNSGDYTLIIQATKEGNYKNSNNSKWKINKAPLTIEISGHEDTEVYDASWHYVSGYDSLATYDPQGLFNDASISPKEDDPSLEVKGLNAGEYKHDLDDKLFKYNDDNIEASFVINEEKSAIKLTISKAALTISISAIDDASFEYDGHEHHIWGFAPQLEVGDENVYDHTKVASKEGGYPDCVRKNVGTTTFELTDQNIKENYKYWDDNIDPTFVLGTKAVLTLDITPRPLEKATVKFKPEDAVYVYTGNPIDASFVVKDSYVSQGPIINDGDWYVESGSQATDIGTYTLKLTAEDSGNYSGSKEITWSIVQANMDIYIDGSSQTVVYDASAHEFTDYEASSDSSLFDPTKLIYTPSNVVGIDAGVYSMNMDVNKDFVYDDPNIKASFHLIKDGVLTILPAPLQIVTDSAEKVYDGLPLTASGSIEGFVADETASLNITGSQTEVGESDNTYNILWDKSAKESNYKLDSENIGKLKVTPAPVDDEQTGQNVQTGDKIFLIVLIIVAVLAAAGVIAVVAYKKSKKKYKTRRH